MKKSKPFMTIGFIVSNVVIFLIMEILGDTQSSKFMAEHGAMHPDYITITHQYWRFFTSTFLHFGAEHLLNNMVVLGASGVILEEALGHTKYAILYLLAGIGGSILSCSEMLLTGEYAVSAGASGAIFGVIGGLLWVVIRHKGHYETLSEKGLLLMIALSLYYGISNGGIDNWGHIGGLIAGFVLSAILYRKKPQDIDFMEENLYT